VSPTTDRLAADLAGRYRVDRELGAGGMATVYLADDLKHKRRVAIKVLRQEFAATLGPERFLREIETTAALHHPHILPLYDSGEAGGSLYYVMPFVDGESLRDRLTRERRLPLDDVLQIAREVTDALAYAHGRGVIHRDIKPENILLSDGHALVADFGIAKAVSDLGGQRLTQTGLAVGTPAYMSPEQALADASIDARSDIFSLGCVVYEMLAGEPPYSAPTAQQAIARRLTEAAPALLGVRPEVGAHLSGVMQRVLASDPAGRPESAAALRKLLSDPARIAADAVPGFGGRPAIAVLPFDNRSGDPEQEFFADGLAEDLTARLSLWRSFPVISRNAAFALKGRAIDLKQVSRDLGARYVVQGSVRKAGNRVRIAAQLSDAVTGRQDWAATYDRELTDVFAVQDEISESIAASLMGDLHRVEAGRAQRREPGSLEGWELYQRALPLINGFTRESMAEARALLERATELDAQFAPALARLGESCFWQAVNGWVEEPDGTLRHAIDLTDRAIASDPREPLGYLVRAVVLLTVGDAASAIESSRRAIDLNPSEPMALAYHAYMLHMTAGATDEAIALNDRALRLSPHDPMEWIVHDSQASAYWNAGRFDEGLATSRRLIALAPAYYFGYLWAILNAVGLGRLEEAREFVRLGREVQPQLSIEFVRQGLGALAPDVQQRMAVAMREAGLA
jgi:TolB-like protein/tRNA A-37 threonylcarbamoyl transferase component Bud32/Flp pilus assembly protein TadD